MRTHFHIIFISSETRTLEMAEDVGLRHCVDKTPMVTVLLTEKNLAIHSANGDAGIQFQVPLKVIQVI